MTVVYPPHNSRFPDGDSPQRTRILVVDDEPAVLFAYRKLIEKDGIAVDISTNFDDAIRLISANRYLAVIADLRLAGTDNGDGLEILRFIQREHPGTKSILATGYGDGEVEETARELGATHCFRKPVQPADILQVLKEFASLLTTDSPPLPA